MTTSKRDLLSLYDLGEGELDVVLERAIALKALRAHGEAHATLPGAVLGMIFEKASTRTRVSFEVGMFELGGHAVFISADGSQIGRGEPIEDTAKVLGGYCHGLLIRTFAQERAEALAASAPVPVINGLTDLYHPCQLLADLMTVRELRGQVSGLRYAWIGDGNNMAHSWLNAAAIAGFDLVIACPEGYDPDAEIVAEARRRMEASGRGSVAIVRDPAEAARGADVISTDVWASMGQEEAAAARARAFAGYCVSEELVAQASPEAIVLHCLPAHRGEEITAGALEGPRSAVWQQAENRLHAQKAILERLLQRRLG
jgi:ornithine carbamoyltransferase